jgi:hypothetical protein
MLIFLMANITVRYLAWRAKSTSSSANAIPTRTQQRFSEAGGARSEGRRSADAASRPCFNIAY